METNKKLYMIWIKVNKFIRQDEGINMNDMRNIIKLVKTIKQFNNKETSFG